MTTGRDSTGREEPHPALAAKVVAALDRLARAQRHQRQVAASRAGITPLQGELLRTLAEGPPPEAVVGLLARELAVSQPTVTASLEALRTKGLVTKSKAGPDKRRTRLELTAAGHEMVATLTAAEQSVIDAVSTVAPAAQEATYVALLGLIALFVDTGHIEVARTCLTCRHMASAPGGGRHCLLLDMALPDEALRVNCPEYEPRMPDARGA